MTALKQIAPVAQFAPLASAKCPCCGSTLTIKANKNGIAYARCMGDDGFGGNCSHKVDFGQHISAELRQRYHNNGMKSVEVKLPLWAGKLMRFDGQTAANLDRAPVAEPANINAKPETSAPERRNGLFGG